MLLAISLMLLLLDARAPKPPEPIDPASWITHSDYPAAELRQGVGGVAAVTLSIDRNGAVEKCEISSSSGSEGLDTATCALLKERGRFKPGTDADGKPMASTYGRRVTWRQGGAVVPLPVPPFVVTITVDVDASGIVENCRTETNNGRTPPAEPCQRYTVGSKLQSGALQGKPVPMRIIFRSTSEYQARE